jgi:uncharacterized protein YcfL
MKLIILAVSFVISGCAASTNNYAHYLEQTSRLAASQNAAEAACLLVIAEGIKTSDSSTKAVVASQIDKCRKDPIKIEPPRSFFGK